MKKIMKNNKFIALAFITVFSMSAHAGNNPEKNKENTVTAELTHLGNVEENPLVMLKVDGNENQNEFTVAITDNIGQILYKQNIKGESFTKKFLFKAEEIGESTLYLTVTCRNTKTSTVYELSNKHKSEVNFLVTKK